MDFAGGGVFCIGAEYELPYASEQNPIPFQRLVFTKSNKVFLGPKLFTELPIAYPEKLPGVKATPLDVLTGALGIFFFADDGKFGAFMPIAVELPESMRRKSQELVELSTVQEFGQTYQALKDITPNIKLAREKGMKVLKFNSTSPTDSEFAKWPKTLPLNTIAALIFVYP